MWKFKEQHNGKSALENARWMKEQLEALVGVVPELLSAEVGISIFRQSVARGCRDDIVAKLAEGGESCHLVFSRTGFHLSSS